MKKHPKGKGCWYLTTIFYCSICSRDTTYRQRQYTKKPKKYDERYVYVASWDGCGA